jgi:hypothetical protein
MSGARSIKGVPSVKAKQILPNALFSCFSLDSPWRDGKESLLTSTVLLVHVRPDSIGLDGPGFVLFSVQPTMACRYQTTLARHTGATAQSIPFDRHYHRKLFSSPVPPSAPSDSSRLSPSFPMSRPACYLEMCQSTDMRLSCYPTRRYIGCAESRASASASIRAYIKARFPAHAVVNHIFSDPQPSGARLRC